MFSDKTKNAITLKTSVTAPSTKKIIWYGFNDVFSEARPAAIGFPIIPETGIAPKKMLILRPSSSLVYQNGRYVIIPGENPDSTAPKSALNTINKAGDFAAA
ncbi:hypothetical protein AX774_g1310 [Zancudomyces culisetae]|uniref:Uncharacterized protein n=1 Tax=Zancudomyces culisetae TaxID=1213189 RepID=A0A1R1PW45_ZANCU|nr:hypothetical protein AX774_g1310 [Zancudomyces culisetae]|eukprot:OMH85144.1 hypothetical protein AX774_g1310 [Zancudomyces culisetae]